MEGKLIKNLDTLTPRDRIQFIISGMLMLAGLTLLFIGLFLDPPGVIHSSVLVAFSEIAILAAAILGIDAVYTNALQKIVSNLRQDDVKTNDSGNGNEGNK